MATGRFTSAYTRHVTMTHILPKSTNMKYVALINVGVEPLYAELI